MPEPTTPTPTVSVVMPMHDAAPYIEESVRSILAQDIEDLELIIVDDGSTDDSVARIETIDDNRIRLFRQENRGVASALITGMQHARGALIARHDADDVALPHRLSRPISFLEAHREIGLVGSAAVVTDAEGRAKAELRHAEDDPSLRYAVHFDSPFVHPTVVFRRAAYDQAGGYHADSDVFEDHDLWWRMSKVTRMANLTDVLLRYREVPVSASRTARRNERTIEQRRRIFLERGIASHDAVLLARTGFHHDRISVSEFRHLRSHLLSIIDQAGATGRAKAMLEADARGRLSGFHLNARGNPIAKAVDRMMMAILLTAPASRS